ncbi:MAG: extracellular solute-binding protein [Clostridia bacterium]|nr:extracellular solute-binding protein [Clostridia bacterium]
MNKNIKRTITALVVLSSVAALGTGCQKSGDRAASGERTKLSFWMQLFSQVSYSCTNFGETEIAKELQNRLNMDIEFVHPTQGQENEQFNLMIASQELTDILFTPATRFKGGVTQAMDDGVIIDLSDYLNDKKAPNITRLMKEDKDIDTAIKLDDGRYCGFPAVASERELRTFKGLIVRKDWLDKLGLPIPETIDEWETTLKAFKNDIGAEIPYTFLGSNEFASAFGVARNYYYDVDKKKITFGGLEPGYKDFLTTMNKWYSEGLLDSEFATQNQTIADAKVTSGQTGVISAAAASGINKYSVAMADVEGLKWAGAPYPVLRKGETPKYGQISEKANPQLFITSACKDVDSAVRFLDYGFGEEGHMLYNFGIEGKSYTMENGYPKYTEDMTDNKEGIPMSNQLAKYVMSIYGGPFNQDTRYFEQYLKRDEQKEAIKSWSTIQNSDTLPTLLLTNEEGEKIATILTDISKYWNETEFKLIMGKIDMSEYDACIAKLHEIGIDTVLDVYNNAYERRYKK